MSRTRGGRKVTVHVEYDPDDLTCEAHCHLCTWTAREMFGEGFYKRVRDHVLDYHVGQKGTTGNHPPARKFITK